MEVFTIQPIILYKLVLSNQEMYDALERVRLQLMDWHNWYSQVPLSILSPLQIYVPDADEWSQEITGKLWYQVRTWVLDSYLPAVPEQHRKVDAVLVLLADHVAKDTYGSGLQWWEPTLDRNVGLAIVDSRVCRALMGEQSVIQIDGMAERLACGAVLHEILHAEGENHSDTPEADIMFEWWKWPNVTRHPKE